MALKRNETYPGRFSNPTDDHPQGAFKNRSAPGAQDGSYLEQQWANDWDGFFGRLLTLAEVTPNGEGDTASSSQYYDALKSLFLQRTDPFADIKADGSSAVATALANLGVGLGVFQSYVNVTGERVANVTYTNSTGKPILVSISVLNEQGKLSNSLFVDGIEVASTAVSPVSGVYSAVRSSMQAIVGNGKTYQLTGAGSVMGWSELR